MAKIIGMNNKGGGTPPPVQQPKIDITKSKAMVCEECGYDVFIPGSKFRTISKIVTGTPQDVIIPIEVFLCGECGTVNESFIPQELKNLDK
jgi:DNA-directed RNA polymerase subunit RPC12/RpoP